MADAHPQPGESLRHERHAFTSWAASESAPIVLLAGFLVLLGIYLRLKNFGYPDSFQFDEHHFVENARNYLNRRADWNDHPPLGKLFIAGSISLLGDNPVAWRLPSLVFGLATILLSGVAAERLFRSRVAGLLAAALVAADGFLIAYSRAALLDGFLCCMGALSLLAATLDRRRLVWVGTLAAGIAMSIKFSGVGALFAPSVAVLCWGSKPREKVSAIASLLGGSLVIYTVCYWLGFRMLHVPLGVRPVVADTLRLLAHHAALTDMQNPSTSSWPTWVLPYKPLILASTQQLNGRRALTSLGNLAFWWGAWFVALLEIASLCWNGLKHSVVPVAPAGRGRSSSRPPHSINGGIATVLPLVSALGFLAPWVLSRRDSYIYHFLPSYASMLVLLAGYLHRQLASRSREVLFFLAIATLVAGVFGPLWCYLPVSDAAFRARLFVPSWR